MTLGDTHEFSGVTGATTTEDGEFVLIETTGQAGRAWLALPSTDVPRAVAALLQAAARANEAKGGEITHRATELHQVKLQDIPGSPDDTLLLLSLLPGAPPIAYRLKKTALAQVSQGILQSMGLLPTGRPPGPTQ